MKSTPATNRTTPLTMLRLAKGETFLERMEQISTVIACRAYELFEARRSEHGHDWEDWFRAESELLTPVLVKVSETDGELQIRAEVPGFTDKDLEVGIEPKRLIICGKKQQSSEQDNGKAVRRVENVDEMFRVINLPHEIDPEKGVATLENDTLKITLPNVNMGKKIPVGVKAA
jgi:HSP20 family protein